MNGCGLHELVYNLQINYNFIIYIWNSWNERIFRANQIETHTHILFVSKVMSIFSVLFSQFTILLLLLIFFVSFASRYDFFVVINSNLFLITGLFVCQSFFFFFGWGGSSRTGFQRNHITTDSYISPKIYKTWHEKKENPHQGMIVHKKHLVRYGKWSFFNIKHDTEKSDTKIKRENNRCKL